jgi:hypothetical protein
MSKNKKKKSPTRSKYNVRRKKEIYDGIKWDSKLELNHYKLFKELDYVEVIEFQPYFLLLEPFTYYDLETNKIRKYGKFSYKADFKLKIEGVDKEVIWESKGMVKPDFQIRRKMWYKLYGEDYYYITSKSLKHAKELMKKLKER